MFKTAYNMMKLKVRIRPQTPFLVASGKSFEVTRPAIEFIRLNTRHGETVFIPGSSIKGVLRAGMEAILGESAKKICVTSETMCPKDENKKKNQETNKLPYKDHCPVCRLFGSGDLASRLEISDAFPFAAEDSPEEKEGKIAQTAKMISARPGIQIDRKTGKTKGGALFEYEVLGGGELYGEFTLTNYELYQPGILFTLFLLSNEGFLRYGHSKSRGLGVLEFTVDSIKVLQMGSLKGSKIKGVGMLHGQGGAHSDYGFYLKEKDQLDKEYNADHNALYSAFNFPDQTAIAELATQFRAMFDTFLEEG